MGKRSALALTMGAGGAAGKKSKAKDGNMSALTQEVQTVSGQFIMHPFLSKVLDKFDSEWLKHEDACSILNALLPTVDDQSNWALWLSKTFEPSSLYNYLDSCDEMEDGSHVILRPFAISYEREAGCKGWCSKDQLRNLIQLILVKGFVTDPTIPGTEMLVIKEHDASALQQMCLVETAVETNSLPSYSISCVKGWTRGMAMHLTLKLADEANVLEQYLNYLGEKKSSFASLHCLFVRPADGKDMVDINRGGFQRSVKDMLIFFTSISTVSFLKKKKRSRMISFSNL